MVSMKAVLAVCLLSILSAHGTHGHGSLCSFDTIPKPGVEYEEDIVGPEYRRTTTVTQGSSGAGAESGPWGSRADATANAGTTTYENEYGDIIGPDYGTIPTTNYATSEAAAQSGPGGSSAGSSANTGSVTTNNNDYGYDDVIGPNYGTTATNDYASAGAAAQSGPGGSSAGSSARARSVTSKNNGYDYVGPNGPDYIGPNRPDYIDSIGPDYVGPNEPDYVEVDYLEQDYVLQDNVGPNGPAYEEPNSPEYIDSYEPDYKGTTIVTTTTAESDANAQTSPEGSTSEVNAHAEAVTTSYDDVEPAFVRPNRRYHVGPNGWYYIGPNGKRYYIGRNEKRRRVIVKNTANSGAKVQSNLGGSNADAYGNAETITTYEDDVSDYDDISLIDDSGTSESSSSESESDELDGGYGRWLGSRGPRRTRRRGWGRYPWGYGRRGSYPWAVDSDESDETIKNVDRRNGKRRYPYGRRRYYRGRRGPYRAVRKLHDSDEDSTSTVAFTSTESLSSEETDQYRYGKLGWGKYLNKGSNPRYWRNRRHPRRSTTKKTQTTTSVDGETVYDTEDYDMSPLKDGAEYPGTDYTTYPNDGTDTTTTTVDTCTDHGPDDYQPDNTGDESCYETLTSDEVYNNYDETQSSTTTTATSVTTISTTNGDSTIDVTEATAKANVQTDDGPANGPDYGPNCGDTYENIDDNPYIETGTTTIATAQANASIDDIEYTDETVSNASADAAAEVVTNDGETGTTTIATAQANASIDDIEYTDETVSNAIADAAAEVVTNDDETGTTTIATAQANASIDDIEYTDETVSNASADAAAEVVSNDDETGTTTIATAQANASIDDIECTDETVSNASADAAAEVVTNDDETGTTTIATAEANTSSETTVVESRPDDYVNDDIDYIMPSSENNPNDQVYLVDTDCVPDNYPLYDNDKEAWLDNPGVDTYPDEVITDDGTTTTTVTETNDNTDSDTIDYLLGYPQIDPYPDDMTTDDEVITTTVSGHNDDDDLDSLDCEPDYVFDFSNEDSPIVEPEYIDEVEANASGYAKSTTISDSTWQTTTSTAIAESNANTGIISYPDNDPLHYPGIRFCLCFRKISDIPRNIRERLGMA